MASTARQPRIYTRTGDDGTTGLLYGGRAREVVAADRAERRGRRGAGRARRRPGRVGARLGARRPPRRRRAGSLRADGRGGDAAGPPAQARRRLHARHRADGHRSRTADRRAAWPVRDAERVRRARPEPDRRRPRPRPHRRPAGRAARVVGRRSRRWLARRALPQPAVRPRLGARSLAGGRRAPLRPPRFEPPGWRTGPGSPGSPGGPGGPDSPGGPGDDQPGEGG